MTLLIVNGIKDKVKRRLVFSDLRRYKKAIICLQETHLEEAISPIVSCQWGSEVCLVGDSSQAGGLAILVAKDLSGTLEPIAKDRIGRFLVVRVKKGNDSFILVNVYAPTSDKEGEQLAMLDRLEYTLAKYVEVKKSSLLGISMLLMIGISNV